MAKKYKIVLDNDNCMEDRLCCSIAPETLGRDEDDRAFILDEAGNWPEYIMKAAQCCPNDCITLYDAETGEKIWPKK